MISTTVHAWTGLSRDIKKREQGVPDLWVLSPVRMPISFLKVMSENGAVISVTSGHLPISQEVMKSKCVNYKGAEIYAQLPQIYL